MLSRLTPHTPRKEHHSMLANLYGDVADDIVDKGRRFLSWSREAIARIGLRLAGNHVAELVHRYDAAVRGAMVVWSAPTRVHLEMDQQSHNVRVFFVSSNGAEVNIS